MRIINKQEIPFFERSKKSAEEKLNTPATPTQKHDMVYKKMILTIVKHNKIILLMYIIFYNAYFQNPTGDTFDVHNKHLMALDNTQVLID